MKNVYKCWFKYPKGPLSKFSHRIQIPITIAIMMRLLGNVEVVAVSYHSGGISSIFLHSATRDKVKRCFISIVSVVNITLCHWKHVSAMLPMSYRLGVLATLNLIRINLYLTTVCTEIFSTFHDVLFEQKKVKT
jgi:hypothetical protein